MKDALATAAVEPAEAPAVESTEAPEPAESTGTHAAPAASAVCSRRPAAKLSAPRAETAERVRFSGPVVVLRPGIRVCEMVVVERAGSVDVDVVSAHVPVEFVAIELPVEGIVTVGMVPTVVPIRVESTGVPAVPGGVSIERVMVVQNRAARPIASPRRPSPSA